MTTAGSMMLYRRTQRLAWLLILALAAGVMAPRQVQAQAAQASAADRWQVYGTISARGRDDAVHGGSVVTVQPRSEREEPWSSGAAMDVPGAIRSGERVTAVFWARAARPTGFTVALQGEEPDYARFATAEVTLTTEWQQVTVGGTAPADFAAGSQSLFMPLGLVETEVTLGPAAFLRGPFDPAVVARTFADMRAAAVPIDVRIAAEPGVDLAGTLHLPAGLGDGPAPLAVLIQGHGPNGRGGFAEIIRRLTADGIAALEYDKRGIGQSTGTYREDIERLTADAAAVIAAMRRRPEIDGSRVALIGHSQGGVIAPAVAASDPTIAAIVTLGGSVGDGLPYLQRAIDDQMMIAGHSEAVVTPAVDAAIALLQARIDGADAGTIEPLRVAVIQRFVEAGYLRAQAESALAMIDTEEAHRVDRLRSASDLRGLRVPVLAVFGTLDRMAVASGEAPAARAALAHNSRGRVVVLDGLSHWFQEGARTGGAEEVAMLGPNLGSPRIVTLVGDWLRDVLPAESDEDANGSGERIAANE